MSEFKFACPVCGQHISCDAVRAGSQMQCPTCFQMLIVPQPPHGDTGKLVITASKFQTRSIPHVPAPAPMSVPKKRFPAPTVLLIIAVCVLGILLFAFRDRILSRLENSDVKPPAGQTNKP